jgi:phosphate starvation-inducible protein PhoH and related proteins
MSTDSARRRRQQERQRWQDNGRAPYGDTLRSQFPSDKHSVFKPKSENQALQAKMIDENDIVFSLGPAGTGKTHVAMVKAVEALKAGTVEKILLARPAVESGGTMGFLPGTAIEKMAPYMRPLYDAIAKLMPNDRVEDMIEDGRVEILTLGHMRGRTFEGAFVILDEAQNCTFDQLKMAVTRLGGTDEDNNKSKMVITGDPQQSDLPEGKSGLQGFVAALEGVEGIAMQYYGIEDVIRHPTVARIIDRLEGKQEQAKPAPKAPVCTHNNYGPMH